MKIQCGLFFYYYGSNVKVILSKNWLELYTKSKIRVTIIQIVKTDELLTVMPQKMSNLHVFAKFERHLALKKVLFQNLEEFSRNSQQRPIYMVQSIKVDQTFFINNDFVPYKAYLLKKYNCHINVKILSS